MWYKNIAGRFFGLVTKHACDRRTDRQNYDSQDRTSIAASSGNKPNFILLEELVQFEDDLLLKNDFLNFSRYSGHILQVRWTNA